jgi:hypothetical protein
MMRTKKKGRANPQNQISVRYETWEKLRQRAAAQGVALIDSNDRLITAMLDAAGAP